jgi:phospholipase/carboxylesterase
MTLEQLVVETGPNPRFTILWMHGLGADGHDFEPIVPELVEPGMPALRFIFPHAPVIPVTLNNGYRMRAWYDIVGIDKRSAEDFAGIQASADAVGELIRRENQAGIPSQQIAIAGFSQGGAMALHIATRAREKLAGVIALSCYLPLAAELAAKKSAANASTPIFMAHGTQDPVVPYALGEDSRQVLEAAGYTIEWHRYPMPHSVCPDEIDDIRAFLARLTASPQRQSS